MINFCRPYVVFTFFTPKCVLISQKSSPYFSQQSIMRTASRSVNFISSALYSEGTNPDVCILAILTETYSYSMQVLIHKSGKQYLRLTN
jgi:hypothetical protein